jgi:hypothetical protein
MTLQYFDQEGFLCRHIKNIVDAYLDDRCHERYAALAAIPATASLTRCQDGVA